jgi:hypothetical protein
MSASRIGHSLIFLLVCISAHAQTGIYALGTGARLGGAYDETIYGGTVGVYFDEWHFGLISLGIDGRGQYMSNGGTKLTGGVAGPRVAITPHVLPLKPYVEGVVGAGYVEAGGGSSTNVEYSLLGGLDFTFFPHVDWRVVEFSYGGFSFLDGTLHPKTLSTGLVFRLP